MIRRTSSLVLAATFMLAPLSAAYAQGRVALAGARKTSMTNTTKPAAAAAAAKLASVLEPSQSPLVSFRLLFMTGPAFDPEGKEGVASLTAALLAQGGSRSKPYNEIVEAMYPMATFFGWQADKEMTVFSGTTHVDNLDKYYALVREMLLDPGFREEDFRASSRTPSTTSRPPCGRATTRSWARSISTTSSTRVTRTSITTWAPSRRSRS